MIKRFFLAIFILLSLISISFSQEIKIDFSLGINSEWKLEKFLPLFIDVFNPGNRVSIVVEVIYIQGLRYAGYCESVYREEVEIPPLSQKRIEFLLPPVDFRYPVRVRIWKNGKILKEEKIDFSIERIILPLVLVLGKSPLNVNLPNRVRIQRVFDEKYLPLNYKAYDTYDIIFVDRSFWEKLPNNLRNSITMYDIFTKRVYFVDEISRISKDLSHIPTVNISIPHNTILYSPEVSLLQGQKFLYPDRFVILFILLSYSFLIFIWKRFIIRKRYSLIVFITLLFLFSFVGSQVRGSFVKDALAVGEKNLVFLDPETYVAENHIHIAIFSPFKREINFKYSPNIFLLYNAYYQPQKSKISLVINRKENLGRIFLEKNRVYFLEGISYHFLPIDVELKEFSDKFLVYLNNRTNFDIKDLVFKLDNKENYIGNLLKGEKREFVIWKSGLREPSLLKEILKNYRVKTPTIDKKNLLLWGRIKDPLNYLDFSNIKSNIYRESILIIPLGE